MATFNFNSSIPVSEGFTFGPRVGSVSFQREDGTVLPEIKTPGLITTTSRGVVPHLSRDHTIKTKAVRWVQLPFESFLDQNPPIPTLQGGPHSLHKFLGYKIDQHLLSLCARDPADGREMPANGKDHVSANCIRGVRKISPVQWTSYIRACKPDVVTALSDTPFTSFPYSQKRIMKSLERSTAWLAQLLRSDAFRTTVLVHMAGAHDERARRVFAESLVERLYGKDLELIKPLRTLDEGLSGYIFDLVPLRTALAAYPQPHSVIPELVKTSLLPLPPRKIRLVHSPASPHEILRLIKDVGIDLFDAPFAQRAADLGIALDFRFPVSTAPPSTNQPCPPSERDHGKRDIGHNIFSPVYAHDHSRLASLFLDAASVHGLPDDHADRRHVCLCAACSPVTPDRCIKHSTLDAFDPRDAPKPNLPYTRAYVHHLLHTHEMSSHTLLAMHNLTVMDQFFSDIRAFLADPDGQSRFCAEVERFHEVYDDRLSILDEARAMWAKVERERGKGRLARERSVGELDVQ
ncbi:hypothetical protein PHLGIDRAFT_103075 [Phlebiopsis gigantea 11061_1 CR5-6]|uniref:tRNA-guanine(15) transglycosylase-like domain-containing protein n=1 Tax=Phlebiopsis gigantea (strain 11061_1 CR5-6) TaxID=745531 RepID=A0A0C3SD04_PHLG1|nr:hypothetical protein PHLGIDRAFT_103075 [Phlebiopsis gigantea 11061_1 CR5-6]